MLAISAAASPNHPRITAPSGKKSRRAFRAGGFFVDAASTVRTMGLSARRGPHFLLLAGPHPDATRRPASGRLLLTTTPKRPEPRNSQASLAGTA